jgi:photosystem II stability/assembly factor-like uncharacterized protein
VKKNQRNRLLLAMVAVAFLLTLSYTPHASTQTDKGAKSKAKASRKEATLQNKSVAAPAVEEDQDEDPDLPPGMAGRIDKEAYLRARGDYIDMLRGREGEVPEGARERAVLEMDKQEARLGKSRSSLSPFVNTTDWVFIGPAPIPMGQTTTNRVPVSGRTISIAVHPTDPDTVYVGAAQGGLYKSTNGGTNWTRLFEFQFESLAVGAITIDPTDSSIVYVGTGENGQSADSALGRGLYIVRNANSASPTLTGPFRLDGTGNDVFSGRAISRVLIDPLDHNILFLCTSSATGGNPNTTTTLQPRRGLYRSLNAQSASPTFEQVQITGVAVPNDRTMIDIEMDPANPNLVLGTVVGVTGDGGIYRTANALDPVPTFTRTLTLPNGATNGRAELTVTRSAAAALTFYVATGEISTVALGGPACNANTAGLLRRSTDGGLNWSAPIPGSTGFCGGQCFYDIAVAVTPDNVTIHLGGAAGTGSANCSSAVMKRSTNGGVTFASNSVNLHADEHALAIAPSNPQVVYTGSDGGIWRSTNNGNTWTSLNNGDYSATQFQGVAVHPYDRNFLMGGTQDNGTICWAANGTVSHCRDGDGGYAIIDDNAQDTTNVTMYHTFFNQTNSQILFERATSTAANADGQLSGWVSRGCSGTATTNGISCGNAVLFYAPMAQGPGNPNTIYFGTDRLYRSANRGDNNVIVSQAPLVPVNATQGVVITTVGISPQDDNVRIVGLRDGHVFATTTGSSTMTDVTGSNFPPPNPIDLTRNSIGKAVIDPNNKFTAYISFTSFSPPAGQQIFKTTNLNDPIPTWTPSSSGIPQVPISSLAVDPQDSNSIFAGTEIGVYHSSDGGASWAPYGLGLPRLAVFDIKISNVQRYLRIATHGRGIWEIGIPGRQLPVIRSAGTALVGEGCVPANGVIDPHEDATVSFNVSNIGPGATDDLVVTLLPTGGVTVPSGPVHFGSVPGGGAASQNFQFSNSASCGDTITLTFHLQDGALDFGNVIVKFTLGVLQTGPVTFAENFDGVTAPALPAGWTTTKTPPTGNPPLWVTNTTLRDTLPNSAFGGGSTTPGETILNSPIIAIPNAPAMGGHAGVQMSFRTSYNTEATFDGGVLEISVNGGAFQDILAAGGSFAAGGYNDTLFAATNVLNLRQAWTGNSGGFIATAVNLPASAFGQNAQFRWRVGYDNGTSPAGGGLRIDTISINTVTYICCGACVITCPDNITQSNTTGQCGAVVTYPTISYVGNCGTVTASPASGSFFPVGTTTVVVKGTRLDGTFDSCSFTVTINDTERPVVTCNVSTTTLWPANHELINVGLSASATDNCPGTVISVAVFGDEDDEEQTGDGNYSPDAKDIGLGTLRLRAERKGNGDGRVYLIIVTATDASGHVSRCCRTVTVTRDQSKAFVASVAAQAAAARAYCEQHGTAPPGYFVIGDGATIGSLQ